MKRLSLFQGYAESGGESKRRDLAEMMPTLSHTPNRVTGLWLLMATILPIVRSYRRSIACMTMVVPLSAREAS